MTLYERILGEEFHKLSPLVQQMHRYESQQVLNGTVQIERGKSLTAKLLNFLMKLPKEQNNAYLRLELTEQKEEELWKRTFGVDTFSSTQYQSSAQMVERMGLVKMYFDVYVEERSLCTVLRKTTLFGVSIPKYLRVNIASKAREEDGKLMFSVEVDAFSTKSIINYKGVIKI